MNIREKKLHLLQGELELHQCYILQRNWKRMSIYMQALEMKYILLKNLRNLQKIHIATNTGSVGHKGFITEIIKDDYDVIYCCGPNPMMNSVKNLNFDIPVYVSLESRMGCGIGACLACSCKTKNGMKRICKEGPVFEVKEVNF